MIFGIGTDIVEIERITQKIQEREGFMQLVFSERETEYCQKQSRPNESFAARFAAKEAFLKALGKGLEATFELHKIEVVASPSGRPVMELSDDVHFLVQLETDQAPFALHVSLSHTKTMATATVIIEIL